MGAFSQGMGDIYARVFGHGDVLSQSQSAEVFLNDSPENEEIAQRVMKDLEGSEGAFHAWDGPATEEMRFYFGQQWDDVDRMQMEQLKRPALVFNEIKPVVNAVSGLERLNRVDITFRSRALDSPLQLDLAGDLATSAVVAADDLSNAVEEDSDVAKEVVITGMAWGEVHMDYTQDVNGRTIFEKLPSREMRWPSNCHRPNLEGRDWCARKRPVTRKEFQRLYGKDKLDLVDMTTPDLPFGQVEKYELVYPYYSVANQKANPQVGSNTQLKKTIDVIQYQWRDMQDIYRFQDQDSGEITTLDQEKWDRLGDRMKMAGGTPPPAVKQQKPVYRQVYVCRGVVVEEPVDLPGGYSLLPMTGEWNAEKNRYVGIVHDMLDPQRTKNKAISSALGFHITNAKGGILYKTSAFTDPDNALTQWSRFDAKIEVSDSANIREDIVQREPAKVSPDLGMFYTEGTKAISRVTGINEETVGLAAGQTPSQTARGRQQAGLVVLGWYFDNLNRHRRERARMMLEFIREYWTQGQMLQVGGDGASQVVPLLKDSLPTDYTMVLDESIRHNPNLKQQVWNTLAENGIIQALLKFGLGQVVLALLKFSPLPTTVVQAIQKTVAQNPPQPPQKGKQGGGKAPENPQLTQAKVQHLTAQSQKAIAQARSIDAKTRTDPALKAAELAADAAMRAHELRLKREQQQSKMFQMAQQTNFEGGGMGGVASE